MTDAFIATVVSVNPDTSCIVTPQIIEHDGTTHPNVTAGVVEGITPTAGDSVLVLTTRNNLDNAPIQRYYDASESCGRIIAIVKTASVYSLTGSFKFIGSVEITQNLTVDGNLTVKGTLSVTGDTTLSGRLTVQKDVSMSGKLSVTGDSTLSGSNTQIAGRVFTSHTHSGVTPGAGTSGPVV